jgi:Carboxypeptidase regulatory-like domain
MIPSVRRTMVSLGLGVVAGWPLTAQGVTGAAVQGTVVSADSVPLEAAVVEVTNASTGERWRTVTRSKGRYFLENLSVGGPYRIAVRTVGFQPAQADSVFLSLGERFTANFSLVPAAVELAPITVSSAADPRINAARTGPSQVLVESTIERLPVAERDFSQLAILSPQVSRGPEGGLSFAGQHDRLNALQIDGTSNKDLWGGSSGGIGTPEGLTAVTPEALKELQILTAPFDVRYGNFAGGLVNAVTKSGSNAFHGSVFSYFENQDLTGQDTAGTRANAFTRKELGVTLGGPINRDRIAFFLNGGLTRDERPQLVPEIGSDTAGGQDSVGTGIRYASAVRFQNILRNQYGVDPGSFAAAANEIPFGNLFVKVTGQLGVNSRLEVSHNYLHANDQLGARQRQRGFYPSSSAFFGTPRTSNATRINWSTTPGSRFSNELFLARLTADWHCAPEARYPAVLTAADDGDLYAGVQTQCLENFEDQRILEVTDNFGVAAGSHFLTLGTHDELIHMQNFVLNFALGQWNFDSLDSLEQGLPGFYIRDLPGPLRPDGPLGDFQVNQFGFYVQDRWTPNERLTLTAGFRVDVPYLPRAPTQNSALMGELGINTAVTPSGTPLWSPRLGVSYDASGAGSTFLRGGIGLFAGPPPYFWFQQAYVNTGLEQVRLICFGADVPAFTLDPANQPTSCGTGTQPVPTIAYFDPSFRFPQNLKVSLGIDHRLPMGLIGTVDLLYTRGVRQFYERDVNLRGPVGTSAGEDGRVLYGAIDPGSGSVTPNRRSPNFGPIIQITNGRGDRAYSLTGQVQKRFGNGTELMGAYTYTNAKDLMSAAGDFAFTNLGSTPVDGTLENRNLRTAFWETPHKVTLVGTFNLPLDVGLSLIYSGSSGHPYTYVVRGDANADGVGDPNDYRLNDVIYVPRDANDITLTTPADFVKLDQYILLEPCLRGQRGRLLERNSCRDAWVNLTSARLTKIFGLFQGHSIQVSVDVFNVLNLLDGDWGLVRQTVDEFGGRVPGHEIDVLELVGYDTAKSRGIYRVLPNVLTPSRNRIDPELSRWRMQLSARYAF